jgi:hypothetical protein
VRCAKFMCRSDAVDGLPWCLRCHRRKEWTRIWRALRRSRKKDHGLCRRGACLNPTNGAYYCEEHAREDAEYKRSQRREPTMAELDACEAEQRQCLPAWWPEPDDEPPVTIPVMRITRRRNGGAML